MTEDTTKTGGAKANPPELQTIVYADLKKSHGAKAADIYKQISQIGGFGSLSKNHIGADGKPDFPTLDLSGANKEMREQISTVLLSPEETEVNAAADAKDWKAGSDELPAIKQPESVTKKSQKEGK